MEGRRAPQGLDAEDRIALGLTAQHLAYLVIATLTAYAVLTSHLPGFIKYPLGVFTMGVGAGLAWGRVAHRSLGTWLWLCGRFYVRRRRSAPAATATPAPASSTEDRVPEPATPSPAVLLQQAPDLVQTGDRAPAPARANPLLRRRLSLAESQLLTVDVPTTSSLDRDFFAADGDLSNASGDDNDSAGVHIDADEDDAADARVSEPTHDGGHDVGGARILSLPGGRGPAVGGVEETAREAEIAGVGAPVFIGATQRIAFFSLKGGAGKTTLACEVAAMLARDARHRAAVGASPQRLRVALLDIDMGSANVSMKLGLTHPTIWDLVVDPSPDRSRINECLVEHEESGLRVLLGPPRAIANAESRALGMQRLAQVLSHLDENQYHFVFIDMSTEVNELTTYVLEAVHQVYYVLTPTASGVQDTYRGVETVRRMGHRAKLRFVLNQRRGAFDPTEMLADLGGELSASVARDDAFLSAEDEHRPAALSPGEARNNIRELAQVIYPGFVDSAGTASVWRRLRQRLG
jgi:MinD-like ATPase involved in chromosome partitioning or flagellar assembly